MGSDRAKQGARDRWLLSAGWAAGIAITLVEMELGMDYVFAQAATQVSAIVGWLPMIHTMVWQVWGITAR